MCTVRHHLADGFSISARRYSEAAAILGRPGMLQHDFMRQLGELDEAMKRSEAAFMALRDHINEHQCVADYANGREGRIRMKSIRPVQTKPADQPVSTRVPENPVPPRRNAQVAVHALHVNSSSQGESRVRSAGGAP